MGEIVRFRCHARASAKRGAKSRAARPVNRTASTPAARATAVAVIETHHSGGMRSRCDHFGTAVTGAPISRAISPCDGQRAITSLKEDGGDLTGSDMANDLGHCVLKGKANVSYDCGEVFPDIPDMTDRMSETEEKLAFIARVRAARVARFPTQTPMCTILEIEQGTYKQYETRTPLPYRFLPKFAAATGVSLEWLLTGEGQGPAVEDYPREVPKRQRKAARGKAA